MTDDIEAARQRAIARLQQQSNLAGAKASDPYWRSGPYNVYRWAERGYDVAIEILQRDAPQPGEDRQAYLARMRAAVRARRDDGPDEDDEAWYASAIDAACAEITRDD